MQRGSVVPANTPVIAWRLPHAQGHVRAPKVRLFRTDGESEILAPLSFEQAGADLAWLRVELEAGGGYRLEVFDDPSPEDCVTASVGFTAGEPAPFPEKLGTLSVQEPHDDVVLLASMNGRCSAEVPVVLADAQLDHDEQAAPWANLMLYRTIVDGQEWYSSVDRNSAAGTKAVFATCPDTDTKPLYVTERGLEPGEHVMLLAAELPGSKSLQTDPVTFRLDCALQPERSQSSSTSNAPSSICSAAPGRSRDPSVPLLSLAIALTGYRLRRRDPAPQRGRSGRNRRHRARSTDGWTGE